jgi:hypothetical protein
MNKIIEYLKQNIYKRYFENNNISTFILLDKDKIVWKHGEDNIDLKIVKNPIVYLSNCREFKKKYLKFKKFPWNAGVYGGDLDFRMHIFNMEFDGQDVKFIIFTDFGKFIVHTSEYNEETGETKLYKDGKLWTTLSDPFFKSK